MRGSLLAVLVLVPTLGAVSGPADAAGVAWCTGVSPNPDQEHLLDMACTGPWEIRPGAWAGGCTMDFVVTDGQDYYVGIAGHCGGTGKVWKRGGDRWGETVFREFGGTSQDLTQWVDWAFIRVDDDHEHQVSGTMYRWGGPMLPGGLPARAPVPGDVVLQYGHGAGWGREDATKGRAAPVLAVLDSLIIYAGTVGGGDSGSPVRLATGEPAGIAVAYAGITMGDNRGYVEDRCDDVDDTTGGAVGSCLAWETVCPHLDDGCDAPWNPGAGYPVIVASRFDAALAAFQAAHPRALSLVEGDLPALAA